MSTWLSRGIFDWSCEASGGRREELERVRRPHAILSHAEGLLCAGAAEFSIADSVFALKRAINSRLQHLEELYGFQDMFPRSVGALERLEAVGLARPFLIKQLFELRNDIEHKDAAAPSSKRTGELVDITWYFLQATDPACKARPQGLVLRSAEEGSIPPELWVSLRLLDVARSTWEVTGWVARDMLQDTIGPSTFEIKVKAMRSKPVAPVDDHPLSRASFLRNSLRSDDERWIEAEAVVPQDLRARIWRTAFAAV
jgi:hypothetical protein